MRQTIYLSAVSKYNCSDVFRSIQLFDAFKRELSVRFNPQLQRFVLLSLSNINNNYKKIFLTSFILYLSRSLRSGKEIIL